MNFSIRDLFLVTMIAALAVGWWVDRLDRTRLAEKAKHSDTALEAAKFLARE
jgi:hypothetical protein